MLIVQDGAPWLLYASSNASDRAHVYSLWQDERLAYFGEAIDRMDVQLPFGSEPFAFVPVTDDRTDPGAI